MFCVGVGQVYPPPGGNIFVNGSTAELVWSFDNDDDLSKAKILSRSWNFINSAGLSRGVIASINADEDPVIRSSILPGVDIKKPATLVLRNVDDRHNGRYVFTLSGDTFGTSGVTIIIAGK